MEAAIAQLQGGEQASDQHVVVINAFDVPKISYDVVSRKMYADKAPRSIFADAKVLRLLACMHTCVAHAAGLADGMC